MHLTIYNKPLGEFKEPCESLDKDYTGIEYNRYCVCCTAAVNIELTGDKELLRIGTEQIWV